jgi:hypothetical protein
MPNTEIQRTEFYKMIDGVAVLTEVLENEVEVPTSEEIIAEKEAELLAMYKELQELKNNI